MAAVPPAYDKTCDLECQNKGREATTGKRHEFVGPVKIVLVEASAAANKRKVWGSAVLTIAMLLLGATVFTVFFFTLKFKLPFTLNIHVLLCTMGFQLFMTTGIIMFSSLFGGSMYLKPAERKFQHFFLEVSGLVCGVLGTLFALGSMSVSLHAFSGFFATVLTIVSSLVGPTEYAASPEKLFGLFHKKAHRCIAVPTFILGTVCFALGLMKDSFIQWSPVKHLHHILLLFTCIYSVTALVSMLLRLIDDS